MLIWWGITLKKQQEKDMYIQNGVYLIKRQLNIQNLIFYKDTLPKHDAIQTITYGSFEKTKTFEEV